jgi:hypothetical protein
MARESFNPKRALYDAAMLSPAQVEYWAEAARYSGNPEHKRNPGDFGLTPPAAARMGKTLCDKVGIFSRNTALDLLREGLRRGLVSRQQREGWPQNVWAITPAGIMVTQCLRMIHSETSCCGNWGWHEQGLFL